VYYKLSIISIDLARVPLAVIKTFLPKHTDRFKAIVRKWVLARDLDICESKLFKHNGGFCLNLVVQKEVDVPEPEIIDKTVIVSLNSGHCEDS